jgi:hypothetical protein
LKSPLAASRWETAPVEAVSVPYLVAPPVCRAFQLPPRPVPAENTSALPSPLKSPTATVEPSLAPVIVTPPVVYPKPVFSAGPYITTTEPRSAWPLVSSSPGTPIARSA